MSESRTSAAVLVLMRGERSKKGAEILLIERSATVRTHQSQVAFPGGGNEPEDENDPVKTALRESLEEVGVFPHSVKVMKVLPPLPTVTGGFYVVPVLGELAQEEWNVSLELDPSEVAFADWASVEALFKSRKIENGYPVFDWLGSDHQHRKIWGLTAVIIELIFNPDLNGVF